jgi:hypothetical protein
LDDRGRDGSHGLAYGSIRLSGPARDMFGRVGRLRRRPLLPSTLATTVPTPADFYNPPYFVELPDTAAIFPGLKPIFGD